MYGDSNIVVTFFACGTTVCSYPKVAISKHFTVNQAQTLIDAQSLIKPQNRHFWVASVGG